jgi:hypothetical protein
MPTSSRRVDWASAGATKVAAVKTSASVKIELWIINIPRTFPVHLLASMVRQFRLFRV